MRSYRFQIAKLVALVFLIQSLFVGTVFGEQTTAEDTDAEQTVQVVAGSFGSSFVLMDDGSVWQWGAVSERAVSEKPKKVSGLENILSIYIAQAHYLALDQEGSVWAWGFNVYGELGDGTTELKNAPVKVLTDVEVISGGQIHSLALKKDGTVWAWGNNSSGQLGDGTTENRNTPILVKDLEGVVALSGGYSSSLALKKDGTVWGWGANSDTTVPRQVSGIRDIKAIFSGWGHSMALTKEGTVWTWGMNDRGQLGDSTTEHSFSPRQVADLTDIIVISGGEKHSIALKKDGTLWAWGDNYYGQLGNGAEVDKKAFRPSDDYDDFIVSTPQQIQGINDIVAISGRFNHSLSTKQDGTIWAWGYNLSGQLGDGTKENQSTPVQVKFIEYIKEEMALAKNVEDQKAKVDDTTESEDPVQPDVSFSDLKENHWAYDFIQWGVQNKLVSGYTDGTFRPDADVTEAEALAIIMNGYLDLPKPEIGQPWHANYYHKAVEYGWQVEGLTSKSAIDSKITRGYFAQLLTNAMGRNFKTEEESIQYLLDNDYSSGKTSKTVEGFVKDDRLSRAEVITFMQKFKQKNDDLKLIFSGWLEANQFVFESMYAINTYSLWEIGADIGNNDVTDYSLIEVSAVYYDATGKQLGTASGTVYGLRAGEMKHVIMMTSDDLTGYRTVEFFVDRAE